MATYRLKPEHPVAKKIEKLFAFLEEEGLIIHHGYNGLRISVEDSEERFEVKDIESGIGDGPLTEYPSIFEYKIVFEKED